MPDPADLCADFRCGHRFDEHDAFSGRCGATVPVDRVSRAYTFCDCTEFTETSRGALEGTPPGSEDAEAGSEDGTGAATSATTAPGPALTDGDPMDLYAFLVGDIPVIKLADAKRVRDTEIEDTLAAILANAAEGE